MIYLLVGTVASLLGLEAYGQRAQLAIASPPYYVGEPVRMQLIVSGFDDQPNVDFIETLPKELTGRLTGVRPDTSVAIRITSNGKRYEKVTKAFYFNFLIATDKPGTYRIGPVTAKLGKDVATTQAANVEFKAIEVADNMSVKLNLPERAVFVGERVPVTIEWGYAGPLSKVRNLTIRSALFEQFEFLTDRVRNDGYGLPIATRDGEIELDASDSHRMFGDQRFMIRTARRILVPTKPGTYDLAPVTATLQTGSAARSPFDLFNDSVFGSRRTRSSQEKSMAVGKPQSLIVKPIPIAGRPESFDGAIGQDFEMNVQANRTTVRVGDPITLTISLKGAGNIDKIGLPKLSAEGGMSAKQFRVPDKEIAGVYRNGEKQFSVSVRVEDEQVDQIPPITLAYFNPETAKYESTRSAAIPLQVMAARVISSSDVVSSAAPARPLETDSRTGSSANGATLASGADLAIETDVQRLKRSMTSGLTRLAPPVFYGVGLLSVIGAFVARQRQQRNPVVAERDRLVSEQCKRIRAARGLPTKEAAGEIADALRKLLPQADATIKSDTSRLIGELETIIYSPHASNGKLDNRLLDTASELASKVNS